MIYEFTPTQDLHGYDNPWPAGGGKNKFNPSDVREGKFISSAYTVGREISLSNSSASNVIAKCCKVQAGDTYYFSFQKGATPSSSNGRYGCVCDDNDIVLENGILTWSDNYAYIIIQPNQSGWLWVTVDNKSSNFQIETGSATPYAPYSNICPLEGYNIWDPNNQEYVQVYSGYVNSNTRELYLRPVYQEYAGEELVGPWMSSLDPYEEDTTPTEGAFVIDFGGELTSYKITPFMLQTLLDSLGIRQHFTNGAGLLNSLMDQAQGRVRSEEELPAGLTFKPISKDVLPGLPGKFIR